MLQIQDTYEVQPGDTLSQIATRFGFTLADLLAVNRQIDNPDLIVIGQKINIPDSTPAPTPEPAPGHGTTYDGLTPAPGTVSTNRSAYVTPPLTNGPGQRDAAAYAQVIDQFAVGNNPRYLSGGGKTYCNIFVWDVTRAMQAEIPHWVDSSGDIEQPSVAGAYEININGGVDWMNNYGVTNQGWKKAIPQQAQDAANQGKIAVVMWKNPAGHGHTAVVRPGNINARGPSTAQAGLHNFNIGHVMDGFGNLSPLLYFWHD